MGKPSGGYPDSGYTTFVANTNACVFVEQFAHALLPSYTLSTKPQNDLYKWLGRTVLSEAIHHFDPQLQQPGCGFPTSSSSFCNPAFCGVLQVQCLVIWINCPQLQAEKPILAEWRIPLRIPGIDDSESRLTTFIFDWITWIGRESPCFIDTQTIPTWLRVNTGL